MGTTRAFINILNINFTPENLEKRMKRILDFNKSEINKFDKLFAQFMPPEMIEKMKKEVAETRTFFDTALGQSQVDNRPIIAYCENEKLLCR